MFDRAAVKFEIYQRLNKSPVTPGFYTSDKVNSALQEAFDLVAVTMFENDQGFMKKLDNLDVPAGAIAITIPPHMAMIEEVRYLVGNTYVPLAYDVQWRVPQWSTTSGATQLPGSYKIIDNKFFFTPNLGGGTGVLQVEYQCYPSILLSDTQKVDPQFDRCMIYYVIYRTCSILASGMGQTNKSWQAEENIWWQKMSNIIAKRNSGTTTIREF